VSPNFYSSNKKNDSFMGVRSYDRYAFLTLASLDLGPMRTYRISALASPALWSVKIAVLLASAAMTQAQTGLGTITGLIRDAANAPIGGATITASRTDGSGIRSTISGSDGVYSFADVAPGTYAVLAENYGHEGSATVSIQVISGRATRADMKIAAPVTVSSVTPPPAKPTSPAASAAARRDSSKPDIWTRWIKGEHIGWHDLENKPQVASLNAPPAGALTRNHADEALPSFPVAQDGPNAAVPAAAPATPPPAPAVVEPEKKPDPFSDWDWTWLNGNSRQKDSPLDGKYFSGEFRADTHYSLDFNQPKDHTMGGSSEVFRSGEVQMEELALGGDFHVDNVRGRVLYLTGLFSTTTPRNDASAAVGQWDVRDAYRYVSEAYGGYHFNVNYGLNIDAGIFVSYVGLFSYHNYDNWAYQPSYVSSNTPWFFNGVRVQWFPTKHLKIEPWFINGWQSYNKFNGHPGLGGQLKWSPKPWLMVIANQYGFGTDTLNNVHRQRYHTDDSVEVKYYDHPESFVDKMAFTFTGDMGCESGGGVSCTGKGAPKQSFLGYMVYNRFWFNHDLFGLTFGGGAINNPGRYLTLVLPINGADAISGTPYFTANPGDPFKAWDATATFDYMPKQFITFRTEFGYRHANVPYFTGRGGITPPGGNNGVPTEFVCNDGTPSVTGACANDGGLWRPDLRRSQAIILGAILVKF
jgi:hypothetical protein